MVFGLVSLGPVTQSLGLGLGLEHLSLDNKCGRNQWTGAVLVKHACLWVQLIQLKKFSVLQK